MVMIKPAGKVKLPDPKVPAVTSEAGTAPDERVPMEVREDETTVDFKVVPVRVLASAVTVISPLPLKAVPLMFLAVVRVAAEPVVFWLKVGKLVRLIAEPLGARKTVPAPVVYTPFVTVLALPPIERVEVEMA